MNKSSASKNKTKELVEKDELYPGYNPNFLITPVHSPILNNDEAAYKLDDSTTINYNHFSLALHKERRFAIWVAWNIDGGAIKRVSRKGISFVLDKRIPSEYQIGNSLYSKNDIDRGHIAKRADLCWGSLEEAKKANKDSFYYSNIAPQMTDFNRSTSNGIWGELENAIFDEVDVDNLRVTMIGGPIFQDNDREYRGILIPREFYKVIIYEVDSKLKTKSFILTQNINTLEVFDLDEFRTYEISLNELEERCNFKLDNILHETELEDELETLAIRTPISKLNEIKWS